MTIATPRILHCHASFSAGEQQRLAVQVMNGFGRKYEHIVISEEPGDTAARSLIDKKVTARFPTSFPSFSGRPAPGKLATIAQAMKGYNLICTYGWGAINVALAHTMFAENLGLPPLIHHETALDPDDPQERKIGRNWYRRIALGRSASLVVESRTLEQIALGKWKQPKARVKRIVRGIDTKAFAKRPKSDALRVVKREGECWVGSLSPLEKRHQLPALVQAFAALPEHWHLVFLGDGPAKPEIMKAAEAHGVEHRVHLPGAVTDVSEAIGLFEIAGFCALDRGFPMPVIEAMAARLPVCAPDLDDVRASVSDENGQYFHADGDVAALASSLSALASDARVRTDVGAANHEKAQSHFAQTVMIDAYRALYGEAMGRGF